MHTYGSNVGLDRPTTLERKRMYGPFDNVNGRQECLFFLVFFNRGHNKLSLSSYIYIFERDICNAF